MPRAKQINAMRNVERGRDRAIVELTHDYVLAERFSSGALLVGFTPVKADG